MSSRRADGGRLRLGVLVSGGGTNLQAILDATADAGFPAEVAVVIANVASAFGLERARAAGVPAVALPHRDFPDRARFDAALVAALRGAGVELVVLAGFMRIVTTVLLDAFPDRVLNVHPSLLPAFPGVDAQGQAFAHGVKVTGCTVHLVDAGLDAGPIVVQAAVPVRAGDDVEQVRARILRQEHRILPLAIRLMAEGRVARVPGTRRLAVDVTGLAPAGDGETILSFG